MQKNICCLFFAALACGSLRAQSADTAFAAARYTFLYMSDTTQPAEIVTENMILYLGKNSSAYKNYDRVIRDSAVKNELVLSKMNMEAGALSIGSGGMRSGTASAYYKNMSHAKLIRIENLIRNYEIDETLPNINWTITQETKNIQTLVCQKATAHFRGRNYTAWFCNELPYNNGPWKLGGLPGLILEAADDKYEVVFRFAGFEDVSNRHIAIAVPGNTIKATEKEYKQLQQAAINDPQGFLANAFGESGAKMKMVGGTFVPNPGFKRKVNNNPIERTDN